MEFDPFDLSVKDLTTKNVIVRSNSTGPLYMMRFPVSLTPSSSIVATLAAVPHTLTRLPLCHINSPHSPPGVSSWATLPTTKAIAALISQQTV
jgi:hypothetical protein